MACATISLKRSLEFDPLSPRRPKRRRCAPLALTPTQSQTSIRPASVFKDVTTPLSREQLAASISAEIKRLQHRRQLVHTCPSPSSSDSTSDAECTPSTSHLLTSACSISPKQKDAPIFTFRQVTLLCERMVKEHTEQLCEQYDRVLAGKLAEQYEAFLKFNHDQLQRRFADSDDAFYVS